MKRKPAPRAWTPVDVPISRRSLIKALGLGMAASALPLPSLAKDMKKASVKASLADVSPIDRSIGDVAPKRFTGDDPDLTHRILWDKAGFIASKGGKLPEPAETADVVVVGGGQSGLFSAYLLRKHKPVVLERAGHFGGGSRGENWNGIDYSIGAAYFVLPEPESDLGKLMAELGVDKMWRHRKHEDPVEWKGKLYHHFWDGETAPEAAPQFKKLAAHFQDVYRSRNGYIFPDVPVVTAEKRASVDALDRMNFREHLEKVVGGKLHPHIDAAMEHFCWSSFAASFGEVSAATGLNFYAGEVAGLVGLPGGNSAVAERVLERLSADVPRSNLRNQCIVLDVKAASDHAVVTYVDPKGELKAIRAKAVVMACPKFAVNRILADIEPERSEAIRKLRYNSYLVANVLLKGHTQDKFYDLFMIGSGGVNRDDVAAAAEKQKVTDVVLGTWAKPHPDRTVLTLYRAMPYPGGRSMIYAEGAYERIRAEFERQIQDEILGLVGKKPSDVVDLRLTRWGHPLPVSEAGLIADGTIDVIRKPFRERVFFVEQDNWMLPAIETAVVESMTWAPRISALLGGKA